MSENSLRILPFRQTLPTLNMVLYAVLTFGLYPIFWALQKCKEFNDLIPTEKNLLSPVGITALLILNIYITFVSIIFSGRYNSIINGLSYFSCIFILIISYKMIKKLKTMLKKNIILK